MTKVYRQHHALQILKIHPPRKTPDASNNNSDILEKKPQSLLQKIHLPYTTRGFFEGSIGTIHLLKLKQSSITCMDSMHITVQRIHVFLGHLHTSLILTWICSVFSNGRVHGGVHWYIKEEMTGSTGLWHRKSTRLRRCSVLFNLNDP